MTALQRKELSHWVYLAAAVIITAVAFFPSLSNGFTNWDDEVYVLNNENIREFSWDKVKYWFGAYHHGNYHPFTMISYMWEYGSTSPNEQGVPTDASIFHLNNYILHLVNTLLVFLFVNMLVKSKEAAFMVATLFGVHPMHVESVAWISERKDVLYTAFYLGALIFYLRYRSKDDWKQYGIMFLLFVCSLLSKSAAVVFPVTLLLIDYYQKREFTMRLIAEKAPLFLSSVIFGILAIKSQNATEAIASYDTFTTIERVFFAGYGSLIYVFKAVWPTGLTAFHPYPSYQTGTTLLPYKMYIVSALSVIVFGGALFFWKKSRLLVFGLFFYLVNVALVLQFVSVGSAIYAERYSYVAYIGLFFLMAMGITALVEQKKNLKTPVMGGMLLICLGLGYLTFEQTKTWKDAVTLWEQFNKVHPDSKHGEYKIAEYYMDAGNDDAAYKQFEYMTKKYPTQAGKAHMGMGNILGKRGKVKEALEHYNIAQQRDVNDNMDELYINRAITYSILKEYDKAFLDYAEAIKRMPNNIQIYQNRGFAYLDNGNYKEAINDFNIILQVQPNNQRLLFLRALAYHRSQQLDKAIEGYTQVLQLNPNNGDAMHNRAICFEAKGDYKKAYNDIVKAQQLGKKENPAYVEKLRKQAEG